MALIGALLNNNSRMEEIGPRVSADDFHEPLLGTMFGLIKDGHKSGRTVDGVTVRAYLHSLNEWDANAGKWLADVVASAAFPPEDRDYADLIRATSQRRKLIALAGETKALAERGADPVTIIDDQERRLREIGERAHTEWVFSPVTATDSSLFNPAASGARIPTGWRELDKTLRGWPRGKMTVVAARPSMGKSMVAVEAMRNIAQQGYGTGLFSLEMGKNEVWLRMACGAAYEGRHGANPIYSDIASGQATQAQIQAAERARQSMAKTFMMIDDRPALKTSEMLRWGRRLCRWYEQHGVEPGAIFVDYLQICRPEINRNGNRVAEVTDISAALMAMAKELNVAVIALSQINRASESRTNNRPTMADLRDSGAIEQDADAICMLYRPAYYLERKAREEGPDDETLAALRASANVLEIDVQKNRNGPTGVVEMFADIRCNAVRDPGPRLEAVA